jgi:hypothetical protein
MIRVKDTPCICYLVFGKVLSIMQTQLCHGALHVQVNVHVHVNNCVVACGRPGHVQGLGLSLK